MAMNAIPGITVDKNTFLGKFDEIISRGLCRGKGNRNSQMCIEAAICTALDLPFSDDPECVARSVRQYKICINDKKWSSPEARAKALRDIGVAQLGSRDVVDGVAFSKRLAELTIQVLIPTLFRERFPDNPVCLAAADLCEKKPTSANARKAQAYAADAAAAADAADAAYAADADAKHTDKYLLLSVSLAMQVLRELKSPGLAWLEGDAA
jgi:hypothetical protein